MRNFGGGTLVPQLQWRVFFDTFLEKVSKKRRFAIVRVMLSAPCFAPRGAFASAQEVQNDRVLEVYPRMICCEAMNRPRIE